MTYRNHPVLEGRIIDYSVWVENLWIVVMMRAYTFTYRFLDGSDRLSELDGFDFYWFEDVVPDSWCGHILFKNRSDELLFLLKTNRRDCNPDHSSDWVLDSLDSL